MKKNKNTIIDYTIICRMFAITHGTKERNFSSEANDKEIKQLKSSRTNNAELA